MIHFKVLKDKLRITNDIIFLQFYVYIIIFRLIKLNKYKVKSVMKNIIYLCIGFLSVSLFFGCDGSSNGGAGRASSKTSRAVDKDLADSVDDSGEESPEDELSTIVLDSGVYIAMGDGITSGSGPSGRTWAERLKVSGVDIINLAVSGTYSSYGSEHIDEYMREYKPTLVMVLYGVNDVSAGVPIDNIVENLEEIIQVVHYYGGSIILGTIPIVTKYSLEKANDARNLNDLIEELCIKYDVECAAVSKQMVYDPDLYLDDLHPTLEGHKYIQAAFRTKITAVTGK